MEESLESKRRKYKPSDTMVLFVGESPPANGTFFYWGNSNLSRYTQEAFAKVYGRFDDPCQFLRFFRDNGFYLVDLCLDPVNNLPDLERQQARERGVERLAATMRELQPRVIVVVMKAIEPYVTQAVEKARLTDCRGYALPFPNRGHQRKYVEQLAKLLRADLADVC